ncbi:MAG: 30S ribosomal protein S21 [Planctomycetota bacterium]
MIKVQLRPNEPLDAALRRFKRQCNYAGVFRLAKKYTSFEKASDKRRREERERIRNIQRAQRRMTRVRPRTTRKSKVKATAANEAAEETELTTAAE